MMHGFIFPWGGFWGMILIWVLLIAGAVGLVKALFSNGTRQPPNNLMYRDSALEILNRRYAKGELSREEFETMKQDLADS